MVLGIVIIIGIVVAGGLLYVTTDRLDREIRAELISGEERE